jgi:glycerate kinase
MRILIVPDKFKGTLTAQQAAQAIGRGWTSVRPADELELLPMSDGGDGFGEIISQTLGAEPQTIKTVDAAHRPIESTWWYAPATKTAIIESARIIGLALLPRGKYHPFELDTFGLGAVLEAAANKGAQRALIGI